MTKRKPKPTPTDDDLAAADAAVDAHLEIDDLAELIVARIIPNLAEWRGGICLHCLGRAVIASIEVQLKAFGDHGEATDAIGTPEGNA
jgi:hypothetical protein